MYLARKIPLGFSQLNQNMSFMFSAFQELTEKMLTKLASDNQQKVEEEDERIAKAVAEREKKRADEELARQQKSAKAVKAIYEQRIQMVRLSLP